MDEIVIGGDWRARLRRLGIRRRESWAILGACGLVVVVGLAFWLKPAPARIAPPARTASSTPVPAPSAPAILVHVAGAVMQPGLYEFPTGARVADAVESAGGPARRADLDLLNLAEILTDGMKVMVPVVGETASAATVAGPSAPQIVPINSADAVALETIPGIGPVTALAIIQARESIGGFTDFEDLLEVDGIGPSTLGKIRPYISL